MSHNQFKTLLQQKIPKQFREKLPLFQKKENWMLLLLAGILLLVIALPTGKKAEKDAGGGTEIEGSMWPGGDSKDKEGAETGAREETSGQDAFEEDAYKERLKKELVTLLEAIDGVGEVRVMITFSASGELVLEKDERRVQKQTGETGTSTEKTARETSWEESTVYGTWDKEKEPFVVQKIYPKVEGVVVAARGVGTGHVRSDISEAVQALFGLEAHKVKVLKLGHISSSLGIE